MTSFYEMAPRWLPPLGVALALSAPVVAQAQLVPPRAHEAPPVEYPPYVAPRPAVVELEVVLDETGRIQDVREKRREPADADNELVDAAIAYARGLSFEPARKDGKAIPARIAYTVHFDPPPASAPALAQAPSPTPAAVATTGAPSSPRASAPGSSPPAPAASVAAAPAAAPAHVDSEVTAAMGDEVERERHPHSEAEITVVGRTEPRSRGVSDFHIHVGSLSLVPRKNASDLLKLAPGILLTNEGGEGHAEQVFLRGFDAREGQDIEFTVNNVPINDSGNLHGNGYADTHFIIPEAVSTLRVIEGPFAPHQGNYAVAGSADYELGLERRGLTAKVTTGSFGTQRLLLLWGPVKESNHTFGAAEIYKTDGFGENRDAKRGNAIAQFEGDIGSKGSYRLTTTAYGTSFHSAGVLRQDDYDYGRKKFFDTYDPLQGGDASRFSFAADYETASDDVSYRQLMFVVQRGMRLRENFTGYLLDVQDPLQTPHQQRGDLLDLEYAGTTVGARGSARFRGRLFDRPQEIELGYYARGDSTASTQNRIAAQTGHPYRIETDLGAKLGDIGLYIDANLRPLRLVTLRGGVRADIFAYDVINNCAVQSIARAPKSRPLNDASCLDLESSPEVNHREKLQRSSTASTAVMPRASVLLGPLSGFTLSFSYGEGVRSIDPVYIAQDVATPFASIRAYEGGVGYVNTSDRLTLAVRSVFFQTKVDRDLIFSETAGRNTLGGGTTRTGWVGAVRATGAFFDQAANVTLVRSELSDTHLLVPYVPDLVVRSDSALYHALPLKLGGDALKGALGLGVTYVGRRALPFGQRSDAIFVVDGSATMSWGGYEIAIVGTNLFGRRYRLGELNYASDFHSASQPTLVPMRHFSAGAPRGVFVTFGATFGGGGGGGAGGGTGA